MDPDAWLCDATLEIIQQYPDGGESRVWVRCPLPRRHEQTERTPHKVDMIDGSITWSASLIPMATR